MNNKNSLDMNLSDENNIRSKIDKSIGYKSFINNKNEKNGVCLPFLQKQSNFLVKKMKVLLLLTSYAKGCKKTELIN
jgi:hypothetical protein